MGKVAIFAGHNSAGDNGASGLLNEDAVVKEAMMLAVDYAQRCGHTVVGGASALGQGINQRCAIANNGGAQGIIEFHGNIGGGVGGENYYDARSNESKNLAATIMASATGGGMSNKRGAKPDTSTRFGSLGILRGTSMPGVLHELFFLDNPGDVAIWNASKKALVESVMKGFLQGLGLGTVATSGTAPQVPSGTQVKVIGLTADMQRLYVPQFQQKYAGIYLANKIHGFTKGGIELNRIPQGHIDTIYKSLITDYKIPASQVKKVSGDTIHVIGLADDSQRNWIPQFQKKYAGIYLGADINGNFHQTIELNNIPTGADAAVIRKSLAQDFKIPEHQIK